MIAMSPAMLNAKTPVTNLSDLESVKTEMVAAIPSDMEIDETSTYSALDVLNELKKNKKFHTPVVIMIDDNKEFIKLHYLKDGFAECIMKSKLESEIDRIMKLF